MNYAFLVQTAKSSSTRRRWPRMALPDAPAAEAAKLDHRKATFFSIRFDILLVRLWRRRTADTDTMRSEER